MQYFTQRFKSTWVLTLLLAFVMSVGGASPTWADELTVYDGTGSSSYIPVYGNYADIKGSVSEFIIPASALESMSDATINSMTFYLKTSAAAAWTSTFKVYLKEISSTTFESSAAFGDTGATEVYSGTLDGTGSTMTVDLPTPGYTYNGGNLLIGFTVTTATSVWKSADFYGETQSSYTAFRNKSSANRERFLPKTTFTFSAASTDGPAFKVQDFKTGDTYNYGLVDAGATKAFTLKNPGTESVTVNVATTGGYTADKSSVTIAAKGEETVTVTVPSATGDGTVVFTPTATGLEAVTVNLSAIIRDANKIFIDFEENPMPSTWTMASGWSISGGMLVNNGTAANIISGEISVDAGGEDIIFDYKGYNTWGATYDYVKVFYATTGNDSSADWTEITGATFSCTDNTTWKQAKVRIPEEAKYICLQGKYIYIDNFYGLSEPNEPVFDFTATDYSFGIIKDNTPADFTIKNIGKAQLTYLEAEVTGNFTVNVASSTIEAKGSTTLTVTPKTIAAGAQEGTVTIKVLGEEKATFKVSSYVVTDDVFYQSFKGLTDTPEGWEDNTGWTFANDEATPGTDKQITLPALKVAEGEQLAISAKADGSSQELYYYTSTDGGATWSAKSSNIGETLTTDGYKVVFIEGLAAGNYRIKLQGYHIKVNAVAGFHLNNNAPKLGIFADEAATEAITADVTKDFGFQTTDQTVTYYIKNTGTGTLGLSLGEQPAGFSAVLGKSNLTKDEQTTLTITMAAENNEGYHTGNVTLTGVDSENTVLGTFKVTATGVIVDSEKLNLDFANGATIPATWTTGDWTMNTNGYPRAGYYTATMETAVLTAEANEDIVIVAKNEYTGSYSFSVNYKKENDTEWQTLIAAANLGTDWKTLHATITEAGSYQLQFVGNYAQIQHIYGMAEANEAVMVIYDGEALAAATYDFGNVANDADATHTFTLKNEGKAELKGLKAVLSGEQADHYSVEASATDVAAGGEATITVTQKKDNLGAHTATLTISADEQDDVMIALSGKTRDGEKYYAGAPTISGNKFSTPALKVAAGETLTFDVKGTTMTEFSVEYTTDGGLTWTKKDDYDIAYGDNKDLTLSLGNTEEVTAWVVFNVASATLTNVYGGKETTAPLISITKEDGNAIVNNWHYDFGTLTDADATMTFTVKNNGSAALQSTIDVTGDINATPATLNVAAGESQDITVTLPYAAPFGNKEGKMTITSEGGVGAVTQHFKGQTVDETAFVQDFTAGTVPAGWYNGGWTIATDGYAQNMSGTVYDLISEQLEVKADEVLTFDAKYLTGFGNSLEVSYSTDRKTWTPTSAITLTSNFQQQTINGLEAGKYYLRFRGAWAAIDNLKGWHKTEAPEHDIYVAKSNIPSDDLTPEQQLEPTVDVAALRADETVTAALYFGETKVKETTIDVAAGKTETITIVANAPATEGNYDVYIKVSTASSLNDETEKTAIKVAHRHELAITAFTRDGEGDIEANGENKFDATFKVTVKNNGTATENATVNIMLDDVQVGTTTIENLAADAEQEATVNATGISAGEGGELTFKAVAKLGETAFTTETTVAINVIAAAPKFALYEDGTAVENNAAVDFGVQSEAVAKQYTIKNEGNAALTLNSITAPEGFTVTPALTDENKTIAVGASLDITVTMTAATGKKSGNVDIKYQVASEEKTFTLAVKGRTVPEGTWIELFDADNMPEGWMNSGNNWRVSVDNSIYSSDATSTLTTPRLSATSYQVLNFDIVKNDNNADLTVEISNDRQNWTKVNDITSTVGEKSITAPATGNYYVRFTGKYIYLDNFIGWKKAVVEHDLMITASDIPATATVNNTYSATVNVKEVAGKAESVTATLYVDGHAVATDTKDVTASGTGYFTLKYTPYEATESAVKAYVEVKVADTDYSVKTAEQDFTVEAESGDHETLTGTVIDENDQAVADATVTVTATKADGTVVKYATTTGADGKFAVYIYQTSLSYTVKVEKGEKSVEKIIYNFDELSLTLDFGTGIRGILMQKGLNGTVYTLDGRRVENPVKGRVYIVNGKKVVLK